MTAVIDPLIPAGTKPDAILYLFTDPNNSDAYTIGYEFNDVSEDGSTTAAHFVLGMLMRLHQNGTMTALTDEFLNILDAEIAAPETVESEAAPE